MLRRAVVLGVLAGAALPGAAAAAGQGTFETVPLPAAANSVVLGPDGANWVTLPTSKTVARVSADGTVTQTPALDGATAGLAVVAGKIWAAVPSAKKIAVIDPANPASVTTIATPAGSCGPVAIADGGNGRTFVSLPNDGGGACPVASEILPITTAGVVGTPVAGLGVAFDLVVSSGSLWIPDFDGDRVLRTDLSAALNLQATYPAPAGSGPDGIGLAPGGEIVTGLFNAGSLAKLSPSASPGTALAIFGTPVVQPFGFASVGGSLYATDQGGSGSASLRRFPVDGSTVAPLTIPANAQPFELAPGPDGDVIATDLGAARLLKYTSRPPRVGTGDPSEIKSEYAEVRLTVNPGGNQASTSVEYGPTTAYGQTAKSESLPLMGGASPVPVGTKDVVVRTILLGLKPGATYHYRAIATTPEGSAVGEDRSFTAASTPPAPPRLAAVIKLTTSAKKGVTRISKIRVSGLTGGETITVTCSGKGCPAKKKSRTVIVTAKKAGALTVSASKITKAKLGKGAKVSVQVTKAGTVGTVVTATASKTKKPTVATRCLAPGATKPAAC